MRNFTYYLLLVILLLAVKQGFSQKEDNYFSLFQQRTFYKPFASEISSTLSKISTGGTKSTLQNGDKIYSALTEIHLGVDLPLLYNKNNFFTWQFFMPVSIHVLWSTFEETTAPIVNNDYRFAFAFAGIKYFDNNNFIKNISLKITPLAHESTHLGDEVSIYGLQYIDSFYRVNVSYEYYELGLVINDPDTIKGNLLSFKFGFMGLINHNKGYYSLFEDEIGDRTFFKSDRWAEYYIEVNYKKATGFLTTKTWHPEISVEFRNRVRYQYEKPGKEDRVWCINAFIGYKFVPKHAKGIESVGNYFRYYNGINPYGQFRNIDYRFLGYSIVANF
jgi:hypothetical protein